MKRMSLCATTVAIALFCAGSASAAPLYFNGFETNTAGWDAFGGSFNATRVASGTNGIPSASGSWHAENSASGSAGNWGGYNYGAGAVPTAFQEYRTSADIYLNVGGGWANDTRFDFISAINNSAGGHLQDVVFNAGFYDDATGPGAGTDRFVFSASNNAGRASSFPKNPGRDPFAISTTGWYTFEHHFSDNAGVLNVDLNIYDSSSSLLHSWTLTGAPIAGVGGNRYGWFANNEFDVLAFDNTQLELVNAQVIPEPVSFAVWSAIGLGTFAFGWRRKRTAA
jgi:hypothetical protein